MDWKRIKTILWGIFRSLAVLVNNLYCIPTYLIWCILLHPVYLINPDLYWRLEGQFFQWLLTMVAYWSYSAGYHIVETGDAIENLVNEETLVLVNHQSTSDVPLLMYAFCARRGLLHKLNWIMDAVFQYTNFGIVSTMHGDFFINAGRDRREASLKDLETYLKTKFLPRKRKWLVLFPEGGFLRKRKDASKRYAAKMQLPNLDYVTLPRMGALETIIKTLAQSNSSYGFGNVQQSRKLKYIVDMTIAYNNGDPLDLGSVITGSTPPCNVRMHYKVYPIDEVPHSDHDGMQTWLYNIYIEKNNMLGHYYRTGIWNPAFATMDINEQEQVMSDSVGKTDGKVRRASGSDVVDEARPLEEHDIGSRITYSNYMINDHRGENEIELEGDKKALANNSYETEDEPEEREQLSAKDKTLHLDLLRIAILHAMFIASTLLHIQIMQAVYYTVM